MSSRPAPESRSPEALLGFGIVVLDKPAGPTSHQVSEWVRDLTGAERAGHVGTLDPGVTGCLPVLLDDATRLAEVLTRGDKAYVAVLEVHDELPPGWRETIAGFEGEIYQRPPRKSAVARRLRTRTIDAIEVLERDGRRVLVRVDCAAGTYVRKLCHDLGLALGTGGHMAALRRIGSDPFTDAEAVSLHDLADALAFWREDGDADAIAGVVQPGEAALVDLPRVTITDNTAEAVATGAPVYAPGVLDIEGTTPDREDPPLVVCVTTVGSAVCLGRLVGDHERAEGVVVELERVLV